MGAIVHDAGVAFRVWAPHAEQVSVAGSFNDWSKDADPMASEGNGYWYADLPHAGIGDEYRYLIRSGKEELSPHRPLRPRGDQLGRQRRHRRSRVRLAGDDFRMPAWNELVIYEMHVGTFHRPDDGHAGHLRGRGRRSSTTCRRSASTPSSHAGDGVRRRHLLGLQPGAHLRGRERLRRAAALQGLRQGGARKTASR